MNETLSKVSQLTESFQGVSAGAKVKELVRFVGKYEPNGLVLQDPVTGITYGIPPACNGTYKILAADPSSNALVTITYIDNGGKGWLLVDGNKTIQARITGTIEPHDFPITANSAVEAIAQSWKREMILRERVASPTDESAPLPLRRIEHDDKITAIYSNVIDVLQGKKSLLLGKTLLEDGTKIKHPVKIANGILEHNPQAGFYSRVIREAGDDRFFTIDVDFSQWRNTSSNRVYLIRLLRSLDVYIEEQFQANGASSTRKLGAKDLLDGYLLTTDVHLLDNIHRALGENYESLP